VSALGQLGTQCNCQLLLAGPACRSELPPLTRAAIGNGRAVIHERVWH